MSLNKTIKNKMEIIGVELAGMYFNVTSTKFSLKVFLSQFVWDLEYTLL